MPILFWASELRLFVSTFNRGLSSVWLPYGSLRQRSFLQSKLIIHAASMTAPKIGRISINSFMSIADCKSVQSKKGRLRGSTESEPSSEKELQNVSKLITKEKNNQVLFRLHA